MQAWVRSAAVAALIAVALLLSPGAARHPDWGHYPPGGPGSRYNSQHWGAPRIRAQPLNRGKWSAPIDFQPANLGHYGTPMVTRDNTVVFPVKTGSIGTFHVEGRRASDGALIWSLNTAYDPPPAGWVLSCGASLTPIGGMVVPDSGGRVLRRKSADAATSPTDELVFYGAANYAANPGAYDSNVRISTPITVDHAGTMYFGFVVTGSTPLNLHSGIARISATGQGTWVSAAAAANDPGVSRMPYNCAPALGLTGSTLYVAVKDGPSYLLCLDSTTLTLLHRVQLFDPWSGANADLTDYSTASPTIGPDGQVFCGVLESGINYNDRGWMLHFNEDLSQTLAPGGFGWDNTCSIVPASAVPSYSGSSTYLLLSKYNNYYGIGSGDGHNKVAILDPASTQTDPISGVTIMREVLTKLSPTPDVYGPGTVREWCVNNAAVDELGHAGLVNNEDGILYRWDFDTNTLSQSVPLTGGTSEAYTPTVIGPDGAVYAINGAILFAVGQ